MTMNVKTFCERINAQPRTLAHYIAYFSLLTMFISQGALPHGPEQEAITTLAAVTVFAVGRQLWLKQKACPR
jgi:hypothetical protein